MTTPASGSETGVCPWELLGGDEGVQRLAAAFYARVGADPVLRPIYPRHLDCPTRTLAAFLGQFFGAPNGHGNDGVRSSLRQAHRRFRIGVAERDAWLRDMSGAIDDLALAEPLRGALLGYFAAASAFLINVPGAALAPEVSRERGHGIDEDLAQRWSEQVAFEELAAAVAAGDTGRALALANEERIDRYCRRGWAASVIGLLGSDGDPCLFVVAQRRLEAEPALAAVLYPDGRTLLHAACASWAVAFADLLLRLGADPNAVDAAGHAPLYAAGNRLVGRGGRNTESAAALVRLMAGRGADVNACGGVKACTALHMAARRGNVAVAEALLECGANLESRDNQGETPLRRAVNCGQPEVAALLLTRGADPHSVGSRGQTPAATARGAAMQALFAPYAAIP